MAIENPGYQIIFTNSGTFNQPSEMLDELAKAMVESPKTIPAGYTYLGQFIDHDISFNSSIFRQTGPWGTIAPSSIYNMRNPMLDLETIYGFEEKKEDIKYVRKELLKEGSNTLLRVGDTAGTGDIPDFKEHDLPRGENDPNAIIIDERNDENLAVAQTQVAFMRFHNAVVEYLRANGRDDSATTFNEARKIVILHYQWIIKTDFLPKIIREDVLNDVLENGNIFCNLDLKPCRIPLEFSIAAFRFGHSMIRDAYNWNRIFNLDPDKRPANLTELGKNTGRGGGLKSKNKLSSEWVINWEWFYSFPKTVRTQKSNVALSIDTRLANSLGSIIPPLPGKPVPPNASYVREMSLAAVDLFRSRALGLPSGQEVAAGMKLPALLPEQLDLLLPEALKNTSFSTSTPLWFYLLAEAEINEHGERLGTVGSRIIAETILGLIKISTPSIFNSNFEPYGPLGSYLGRFGMTDMLKFVAGDDPNGLNPLGK